MTPYTIHSRETFNMFNMFNISRVLSDFCFLATEMFNISRVSGSSKNVPLTFPLFRAPL